MSSTGKQLKAIRELVKRKQWDDVLQESQDIIKEDPKNFQAHLLVGFASAEKNKVEDAEKAYEAAGRLKASDSQPWQGLIKLYEKQGSAKIAKYQQAVLRLAAIFHEQDDMYKCQDVVEKFLDFANAHGSRAQYAEALGAIVPDSPLYSALEGRVPHPAKTYEKIAQILETDEKKRINNLIGERRTRIGATLGSVTVEVNREILSQSSLGHIYEQLINWSTDDDIRRQYEEKLLRFRYDRLLVFSPGPEKESELATVQKLAGDMVIINHPFRLAWDVTVNWQDYKEIREWGVTILHGYCSHFPESDLYKVLTAFLTSSISPFPKKEAPESGSAHSNRDEDTSEDDEDGGAPTSVIPFTDADRLSMMEEGVESTDSLLAYRLIGEYYQHLEEHERNVELMRKAMQVMVDLTNKIGKVFIHTNQSYMVYLGTALVFYQSPRNHGEAKFLFDKVLEVDPSSTPAQIGVGLIYEEEEEYDAAIDFLERALQRDSSNLRVKAEVAWLYALKGDYTRCKSDMESILEIMSGKDSVSKELLAQTQHRLGVCIWNLDTSKAARKSRTGAYAYFIDALKSDFAYAPAYTSLGIYYAEYAKDKKRARKCFLKAVELSPSEVQSAERLARSFADDSDWDRVELIAQRVVDSGKVRPPPGSKRKGISWPFSALGVAELNKQDYARSIVSFQSALRMSPNDYHSWVGLGESYANAGRFIAATKAILNAQKLEETAGENIVGDTWFAKYMLANVKREIAEYDDALVLYREVTDARPDEAGVMLALMQTLVESGQDSIEKGFFGKAVELAAETISFASGLPLEVSSTFNFWKAIGDACSIYSSVQSYTGNFPAEDIRKLIDSGEDHAAAYAILHDVDGVERTVILAKGLYPEDERPGVDLTRSLHASILAHKRAVHLSAQDVHAQAVAYYNLGWAEHRAHICLPVNLKSKASRYHKAAVRCFKRAIELEAGNPDFWNSLGVVTSEINPSVAQHAFVRSLHLNERSPHTWTNLGALALLQNDMQLANEAFTRAQSNDPDYTHAWLGQGFVALLYGDVREARGLFTHAMEISESSSLLTRRQYSVSLFDYILTNPSNLSVMSVVQPLFGLEQLQALDPQVIAYGHLSTLYQERTNDSPRAIATLEKACDNLEANYEATESPVSAGRFALAKTDLARSYLAAGRYEDAIECGEISLELSSIESGSELTEEQRKKARLSAHLTIGLAQYFNDNVDDSLAYFESALEESDSNPDAVCLLAQVLWATGTEEARERARSLLFDVIGTDSTHVQSVLLLGIIALLDEDQESLEAVVAELLTLRTSDKITDAEQSKISEVLRAVAALSANGTEDDVTAQVQSDVMLYPNMPHGWSRLADSSGEEYPAEMALKVAAKAIPPRGDLGAADLANAYAGTARAADAQISIFIAPWASVGWESLNNAVAG
ncbi:tetratricopeptide [Truncatella angustata]|uniref:Tetratricopeptide n=1 Tax=Truncatella angustata TaxID=152316 RepID=A0A9P8UH04_9PEZI|nr:tetratricopeptide [Truncatella angustata]KAH6651983.1 tetratricopeptide [Truncatella angustata]